jgi:hypothetical protein
MKSTNKGICPIVLGLGICVASTVAQTPGTFTATGSMAAARFFHTATLLNDGKVWIAGGESGNSVPLSSAELYDPSAGVFTAIGNMMTARWQHTATLLPDGRVLIAGGSMDYPMSAEIYDPSSGIFTATGDMVYPTSGANPNLLANGKVIFTGGFVAPGGLVSAEIYDTATGTFAAAGPCAGGGSVCDYCAPAISLADGRVLFAAVQPAQIYDTGSAAFSVTGFMNYDAHTGATLLMNGQALFSGGEDDSGRSNSAELFDPAKGAFSVTGNMASRRVGHTSTLLPDGAVLVAGGETDSCGSNFCMFAGTVASAELYDPSTGSFTATGGMTASRELQTATLLRDGRVLVTGGIAYGGIDIFYGSLSSAENYTPAALVPAPALFSLSGDGQVQGAVWHSATGEIASSSSPAVAGEALSMYTTSLAQGGVIPPQVTIGGQLAQVLYFSDAPGYPGYNQVNFLVPNGVAPGPAVPVRLTYLRRSSNEVTIAIQ